MLSAVALMMLGSMLYSLRLSGGSFPKPLSAKEERHYLKLAAEGDLAARNILVERNLRLVAHIMKNMRSKRRDAQSHLEGPPYSVRILILSPRKKTQENS